APDGRRARDHLPVWRRGRMFDRVFPDRPGHCGSDPWQGRRWGGRNGRIAGRGGRASGRGEPGDGSDATRARRIGGAGGFRRAAPGQDAGCGAAGAAEVTMSPEEGLKYLSLFFLMGGGLFVLRPIVTALSRRIAGEDRALRQGGAERDALADEVRELRQEM